MTCGTGLWDYHIKERIDIMNSDTDEVILDIFRDNMSIDISICDED